MTYQCLDCGFQLARGLESGFLLTPQHHGKEIHEIVPRADAEEATEAGAVCLARLLAPRVQVSRWWWKHVARVI